MEKSVKNRERKTYKFVEVVKKRLIVPVNEYVKGTAHALAMSCAQLLVFIITLETMVLGFYWVQPNHKFESKYQLVR